MDDKQKKLIENFLKKYSEMSNNSWGDSENVDMHNYWNGQVMGMCKIIDTMKLDIDTKYYLEHLL